MAMLNNQRVTHSLSIASIASPVDGRDSGCSVQCPGGSHQRHEQSVPKAPFLGDGLVVNVAGIKGDQFGMMD